VPQGGRAGGGSADVVPGHHVACGAEGGDRNAVAGVARDDVAFISVEGVVGAISAAAVARRPALMYDAGAGGQGRRARGVRGVEGVGAAVAADAVILRPGLDQHPVTQVPERGGAGGVGADEVAGDRVAVGAGVRDHYAGAGVAADDVTLAGVVDPVAVSADPI